MTADRARAPRRLHRRRQGQDHRRAGARLPRARPRAPRRRAPVREGAVGDRRAAARRARLAGARLARAGRGVHLGGDDPAIHAEAARAGWATARARHRGGRARRRGARRGDAPARARLDRRRASCSPCCARGAQAMHVVLTGRGAPPALVEAADLVTEMRAVKHPFEQGREGDRRGGLLMGAPAIAAARPRRRLQRRGEDDRRRGARGGAAGAAGSTWRRSSAAPTTSTPPGTRAPRAGRATTSTAG